MAPGPGGSAVRLGRMPQVISERGCRPRDLPESQCHPEIALAGTGLMGDKPGETGI